MPELSRFYGIVIRMFYDDHPPPHFHVEYGEYRARVDIEHLALISGHLPGRALGLVVEWASLHQTELMDRWRAAENQGPLPHIDPLP